MFSKISLSSLARICWKNSFLVNTSASRCLATATTASCKINNNQQEICNVKLTDKKVELSYKLDSKSLDLHKSYPFIWLRDNCRCAKCFDPKTEENEISPADLKLDMVPKSSRLIDDASSSNGKKIIEVAWQDGHLSRYELDELVKYGLKYEIKKRFPPTETLWNVKKLTELNGLKKFDYQSYMTDDKLLDDAFRQILKLGAIIVNNVPANIEQIVPVCERLAPIQGSLYSPKQCVVTSNLEFADRAYTDMTLLGHTDNAYIKNTAGLEAFHVIQTPKEGGESLLIDGFYCAEKLRELYPEDFEFLSKTDIEIEYLKKGKNHLKARAPVIAMDGVHNSLFHIRHNIYNKVNLNHLSEENVLRFYKAMQRFLSILDDQENVLKFKLKPDEVLIFNNFRLMHGRLGYRGSRTLVTTYMGYDEWLSNARLRNLTDL